MSVRTRLLQALSVLAGVALLGAADTADAAPKKKRTAKSAKTAPVKAPKPGKRDKKNKKDKKVAEPEAAPDVAFDKEAAALAISSVDLQRCRATNAEKGEGHVMITFAPAGSASGAVIDKGPWVGTPVAKCLAAQFKKTTIPAFGGEPVTVGKTFRFE